MELFTLHFRSKMELVILVTKPEVTLEGSTQEVVSVVELTTLK